ncbi:MAG TPA: hypothetical protein VFB72_04470, partial [Verrucomicrobiae bacterium]|nr:hypothetical protein [Verrucomicrobiae bacterium]
KAARNGEIPATNGKTMPATGATMGHSGLRRIMAGCPQIVHGGALLSFFDHVPKNHYLFLERRYKAVQGDKIFRQKASEYAAQIWTDAERSGPAAEAKKRMSRDRCTHPTTSCDAPL